MGSLPEVTGFEALPGLGARGTSDGLEILVGRERLLRERGIAVPAGLEDAFRPWQQAGATMVLAGWDGQVHGAMAVADTVKPSAAAAVARLHVSSACAHCCSPATARARRDRPPTGPGSAR